MSVRGGLLRRLFNRLGIHTSAPPVTLESQIKQVVDKHYLHRLIDELPDHAYAILLVEGPEGGDYSLYGEPTYAQLVWMVETFKNYIFNM